MRVDRVIVLLLLIACKGASVAPAVTEYHEDLTVYRPVVATIAMEDEPVVDTLIPTSGPMQNHITAELDSINRIIIARNEGRKWDGYTIQVYNGPRRQEAENAEKTLRELYPEMDPEMTYYRPSYRVKVGSFFDRLEASKFYSEVKGYFREAILLPEKLPLPPAVDE